MYLWRRVPWIKHRGNFTLFASVRKPNAQRKCGSDPRQWCQRSVDESSPQPVKKPPPPLSVCAIQFRWNENAKPKFSHQLLGSSLTGDLEQRTSLFPSICLSFILHTSTSVPIIPVAPCSNPSSASTDYTVWPVPFQKLILNLQSSSQDRSRTTKTQNTFRRIFLSRLGFELRTNVRCNGYEYYPSPRQTEH
jgi:hypothetical protein